MAVRAASSSGGGGGGGTPGGSTTQLQYNNAGSFGGITGATTNGTFVTLTTPVLGVATGTSLALGGATIGSNALAVTGTSQLNGTGSLATGASLLFYNTADQVTNYERLSFSWASNVARIETARSGTGTARTLYFNAGGANGGEIEIQPTTGVINFNKAVVGTRWSIDTNGKFSNNAVTLGDQAQVFAITAAQPASPTGTQNAITATITSAGSASQTNRAMVIAYTAGYTGSSQTFSAFFDNLAAGTGSTLIQSAGSNTSIGNIGSSGAATATTTGLNIGQVGVGINGNVNAGLVGVSQTAKNSATNIGVVGSAINTGTSPVMVGGFFSLNQTTVPTVSAALIADNGAQSSDILRAHDNGTVVFRIADGGVVTSTAAINAASFTATGNVIAGASSDVLFSSRSRIRSQADGSLYVTDQAATSFTLFGYGGTTSSFPALKRSTVMLEARLADDSAYTNIKGKITTDTNYTAGTVVPTGYLTLYDATGTAYRVPCIV